MRSGLLSSLKKEQKEAVGLLQIGTFLEYFDLMLYVHMTTLLNDLFFPKTDPHTAALLTAFAFCSTYILRPFGALIFGWIGDSLGRKATVIITTMMMSISCMIMANLPTYAQIGITASWAVTLCRVIQGLSSMGEIMGAEIYLTEITKPPTSYPIVALVFCASKVGTMVALAVATAVLTFGMEWRIAFWVGAGVAVVGSVARTRLRETPEFLAGKEKYEKRKKLNLQAENKTDILAKTPFKTLAAYFLISSGPPTCLYFSYMYFASFLKNSGLSNEFVIRQNFFLSIIELLAVFGIIYLSTKYHPLKILKNRAILYLSLVAIFPIFLWIFPDYYCIFFIQSLSVIITLSGVPAAPIFIRHFPVLKRFTYITFIYAISRAVIFVVTSFGLVYLTEYFGHLGANFILIPVTVGFLWAVHYFEQLEEKSSKLKSIQSLKAAA